MIYGLNFNGTEIPEDLRKGWLPKEKPFFGKMHDLKGVATSYDEACDMQLQANNGRRSIVIHKVRRVAGDLYGVYIY